MADPASPSAPAEVAPAFRLRADAATWDAWVARAAPGAFAQQTAWAAIKAANGWSAERVVIDGPTGPVGAQILLHRLGPAPWAMGYAPRGPVAGSLDAAGVAAWSQAVRDLAARRRLSHVVVDPAVPAGDAAEGWLADAGWRRTTDVQPSRTRLIDLARSEADLWGDLRGKWRQYVTRARREGVTVVDSGADGLADFFRIYVETARRAGFIHRVAAAYEATFTAFLPAHEARLLFAQTAAGERQATLMLLACGSTVVEPYGGMTAAGAASRANYLLKWEAIRSSRERGFGTYDLWGLAHAGIEQFKVGFGGREVVWTGAWELITRPFAHRLAGAAQAARLALAARRLGRPAPPVEGGPGTPDRP